MHLTLILLLLVFCLSSLFQMGMMKEHVRGPIKCCETIAADVLYKTRAKDLVYHLGFKVVDTVMKQRQKGDFTGGISVARYLDRSSCYTC